jgi:hypothetical protein
MIFYGILCRVCKRVYPDFEELYERFQPPIARVDCGMKCAPYNDYGVPFCCDTAHAVPAAYQAEWVYLQEHTNLWHLWVDADPEETERLRSQAPDGQVLIECLGYEYCQRDYRSITCRAFPFFPYVTLESEFLGMTYYWQYQDRCWVISHLEEVTPRFRESFATAYEALFRWYPEELENFRYQSIVMRRVFGRRKAAIPLLHRDGYDYQVNPRNGELARVNAKEFPKYDPYEVAAMMPFPDELEGW